MKNIIKTPFAFLGAAAILAGAVLTSAGLSGDDPQPELAIGAKAPLADAAMTNVDGTMMTLEDAAGPNGLLVVFSCNTCPFVVGNGEKSDGWEGRYNSTNQAAERMGIGMVLLNSNEAKRDNYDSMEAMQKHAKDEGYKMPYLLDKAHRVADAFGALKTPHVYLFDNTMALVYRGSLDDNVSDASAVESNFIMDAMTSLNKGKACDVAETKAIGCSIKRMK
jgi:hypothetical protein